MVVIRDKAIRRKPVEKQLWQSHGLRGFVLTGRDSQKTEDSPALILQNYRKIDELITERSLGPWMMALSSAGLREVDLS